MGSSRFPGKMMAQMKGYPLMEWVIRRAQQASQVSETVLATTTMHRDDALVDIAEQWGCPVFRGSENDVLGRFSGAAKKYQADIVVRVCADRPLVDPALIDSAVDLYCSTDDIDLAFNHISDGEQYWPRGFGAEVFSAELLFWMNKHTAKPFYREHVTPYIWENRSQYTVQAVACPPDMNPGIADLKLDVDEREDLDRLRTLCANLGFQASTQDIIKSWSILTRQPEASSH